MAHEVETMFTVGEEPWHGLGRRFTTPPATIEEAINAAGLGWHVDKRRLFLEDGREAPAFATVRDADQSILGVVGERYVPLQNVEAFRTFQPLLDSGEVDFEAAGSLRGGARIWVLAKLRRDPVEIVPGDPIVKFVLLSHGHDGGLSVNFGLTPIRVVCANTEALARGSKDSKLVRIRHTASMLSTLDQARDLIDAADGVFRSTFEQYKALAAKAINGAELERYFRIVTGTPEDALWEDLTKQRRTLLEDLVAAHDGIAPGADVASGTLWGAYNAYTWHLNHQAGRTADGRLNSLWYGKSANDNQRALNVALQLVAA